MANIIPSEDLPVDGVTWKIDIQEAVEGGYTASVKDLAGCVTQGEDLQELRKNMADAIRGYLASIASK